MFPGRCSSPGRAGVSKLDYDLEEAQLQSCWPILSSEESRKSCRRLCCRRQPPFEASPKLNHRGMQFYQTGDPDMVQSANGDPDPLPPKGLRRKIIVESDRTAI